MQATRDRAPDPAPPPTSPPRAWLNVGLDFARRLGGHQVPLLAAAIAYNGIFALFPLLLGLISLAGFFIAPEKAEAQLLHTFGGTLPDALSFVPGLLAEVHAARGPVGAIAALLLVWSGKNLFATLAQTLDLVWEAPPIVGLRANAMRQTISTLCALAIGGLAIAGSVLYALIEAARSLAPQLLGGWWANVTAWWLSNVVPGCLLAAGLAVAFRVLPACRMPWRAIGLGAGLAALAWEIMRRAFGFYVAHAARYSLVYGPLAGLILLLFWIYLSGLVVLAGAEVTGLAAGVRATPLGGAARVDPDPHES